MYIPKLRRRDGGRVWAKCAYSHSYTDRDPYSDTNSHSDVDTDRYADCYTNIYTEAKASPDSTASPNAAALTEIYDHPCSHPDRNTHV